ncbi:MAG: hypothetical protein KAW88_07415 [Candidatus Cloacimonetes bacterium]|nr:hypothetical protein [Candidatus Cloacimonadota bacterium]
MRNKMIVLIFNEITSIPGITFNAYPSPFNPTITFSVKFTAEFAKDAETCPPWRIQIFNVKGQKVETLECINRVNAKTTRLFYPKTRKKEKKLDLKNISK